MVSPRTLLVERYIQLERRLSGHSAEFTVKIPVVPSSTPIMLSIKVPPLGESIVEATVSRWLKKEGEAVAAGDTLVELETDKITVEVPALKAGVLGKLAKAEGDVVHVDEVLGEIDDSAVPAVAGASGSASTVAAAQG